MQISFGPFWAVRLVSLCLKTNSGIGLHSALFKCLHWISMCFHIFLHTLGPFSHQGATRHRPETPRSGSFDSLLCSGTTYCPCRSPLKKVVSVARFMTGRCSQSSSQHQQSLMSDWNLTGMSILIKNTIYFVIQVDFSKLLSCKQMHKPIIRLCWMDVMCPTTMSTTMADKLILCL